ncbi:MAG: alpha/beta hydrolase [Coriobacteriia bacterium]|nr:alpha/beta hydrolase [Coriobacteriia bacterium]
MNPVLKRTLAWLGGIVLVVLVGGVAAGVWWGTHPLGPSTAALAALESDSGVRVAKTGSGWEFAPASGAEPTSALIYYPGGHVDARSYARYARDLAAKGHLVVVPIMPLSLAVLNASAADTVIATHPSISSWVIGGHSLGGAMAAQYVAQNRGLLSGLVLQGAYAAPGTDLSAETLMVLTQVGTLDTVVSQENLSAGRALLPPSARYEDLQGGNHAQFGDYGPQPGDTANPTMSADEQRRLAVEGTAQVLEAAASR